MESQVVNLELGWSRKPRRAFGTSRYLRISEQIRVSDPIAKRVTNQPMKSGRLALIRNENHVLVAIQRNSASINQSFSLLDGWSGERFCVPQGLHDSVPLAINMQKDCLKETPRRRRKPDFEVST